VAHAYRSRTYFDANDNVVKTEQEYRDGNNPDLPAYLDTVYTYDILGQLLETTARVSSTQTISQQRRYDANGNPVEGISPMAVAGLQPGNRVKTVYDERDQVYQVIRAPDTPDESALTYRYDVYGNLSQVFDAQDNNGDGITESTTYTYDGYNRLISNIDAAGNETRVRHDQAGNVVETQVWGAAGGPTRSTNSTAGNVLLSRSYTCYDELSRPYQSEAELFVPSGITPARPVALSEGDADPTDGRVTGFTDYNRNSQVSFATAPAGRRPSDQPGLSRRPGPASAHG